MSVLCQDGIKFGYHVIDQFIHKAVRSVVKCLSGGKIADQAKDLGNAKYSRMVLEALLMMIVV